MGKKGDWKALWDERKKGLETLLGPADEMVLHAMIPLYLGGQADVLKFKNWVNGIAYVTADLTGDHGQKTNSLGNYELMMCTRADDDWAPSLISRLAAYTFQAVLEPYQTMDIDPAVPRGSTVTKLLFLEPELPKNKFSIAGRECGLLLCVGITQGEMREFRDGSADAVLEALKQSAVLPFTDLRRKSLF